MDIENIRNRIRSSLKANKATLRKEHQQKTNIHSNTFYGSKHWANLRAAKYANCPLCEVCLAEGIVKSADEIHHKKIFSSGKTDEEKWQLFLDYDNLISVCKKHHHKFHELMRSQNRTELGIDELVQYDKILNDEF